MLEKYYLYLEELFKSYVKILNSNYKDQSVEDNQKQIIQNQVLKGKPQAKEKEKEIEQHI